MGWWWIIDGASLEFEDVKVIILKGNQYMDSLMRLFMSSMHIIIFEPMPSQFNMIAYTNSIYVNSTSQNANYGVRTREILTLSPSPLSFGTPKPCSLCVTTLSAVTPYNSISNSRTSVEMTRYNSAKAKLNSKLSDNLGEEAEYYLTGCLCIA